MTIENRDNLGAIDGQQMYGMRVQGLAKASLGNGVLADTVASTSLRVTQDEDGASMFVDVQLGSCLINGVIYTEAADFTTIEIAAAHATDERIDLIVYDVTAGNPAAVTGTPHATDPQAPDVTDDDDIPLAQVYVVPQDDGGYTGTIVDGDITDVRSFIPTKTCYLYLDTLSMRPATDALLSLYGMSGSGGSNCSVRGIKIGDDKDANGTTYYCSFMCPENILTSEAVELWAVMGAANDQSAGAIRLSYGMAGVSLAGAVLTGNQTDTTVALTKLNGASVVAQIQVSADIKTWLTAGLPHGFTWVRDGDHGDDTSTDVNLTLVGFFLKYSGY